MRITIPIVAAGNRWRAVIPQVGKNACYSGNSEDSAFDRAEFSERIRNCDGILTSSKDTQAVMAFAAILLASLDDWFRENSKGDLEGMERTAERLEKRARKGQVAKCRICLDPVTTTFGNRKIRAVRISISATDNGTVMKERFDEDFALLILAFVKGYNRLYASRGDPEILVDERTEGKYGHALALREEEDTRKAEEERLGQLCSGCTNWVNGYCSPANMSCPLYESGKCKGQRK